MCSFYVRELISGDWKYKCISQTVKISLLVTL
jgi:hypothetical protein